MTHLTGSVQARRWIAESRRGGNGVFFMQGVGGIEGCRVRRTHRPILFAANDTLSTGVQKLRLQRYSLVLYFDNMRTVTYNAIKMKAYIAVKEVFMGALSIRGVDEELSALLKQAAAAENKSVNQYVLDTMRKQVGLNKEKRFTRKYHDLDHLFGSWSVDEHARIQKKIDEERRIDEELWK